MSHAVLSEQPLSIDALLALDTHRDCGGLALFAGTVRDHHEGRQVLRLAYTTYRPLAEKMIREIEAATCREFGVPYCRVMHRLGMLELGEVAIVCVVRAAHRAEAFAACKHAVDTVKHTVPVWKEEFYADGSSAFVQGCCIRPSDDDDPLPKFLNVGKQTSNSTQLICTPTAPASN